MENSEKGGGLVLGTKIKRAKVKKENRLRCDEDEGKWDDKV